MLIVDSQNAQDRRNMIRFIEDILKERDYYEYGSLQWHNLNLEKAFILEDLKPSWTEKVAYFLKKDIEDIPCGFSKLNTLPKATIFEDKRSKLEYNNGYTRQIIPYCLVRCKDEYYFILRENNSEDRLNGNYGLLGGHTDCNIESGMYRELQEEADINLDNIEKINLVGTIKSYDTITDLDHIGLIYLIDLKHKKISMQEMGIQKGMFVRQCDFWKYSSKFESWLKLVVQNLFNN